MLGGSQRQTFLEVESLSRLFEIMQNKLLAYLERVIPEGYSTAALENIFSRQATTELEYGVLVLQLLDYFLAYMHENTVSRARLIQQRENAIRKQYDSLCRMVEKKTRHLINQHWEGSAERAELERIKTRSAHLERTLKRTFGDLEERLVATHKLTTPPKGQHQHATFQQYERFNHLDPPFQLPFGHHKPSN